MTPKDFALMAVRRRVEEAEDALYRAKVSFRGYDERGMKVMHGMSGMTRAQVLADYIRQHAEAAASLRWLEEQ